MKKRILEAAVKEIELHGASFRMDDLAKRLNISKRTLYENFYSKNEIIEKIVVARAHEYHRLHHEILADESLGFEEKLRKYFTKLDVNNTIRGDQYRVMFAAIPSLIEQVERVMEEDWKELEVFLEKQIELGVCRQFNAQVLVNMLKSIVQTVLRDSNRNPEYCFELFEDIVDIVLHGILTEEESNE